MNFGAGMTAFRDFPAMIRLDRGKEFIVWGGKMEVEERDGFTCEIPAECLGMFALIAS
jgi:hypothetical protein